MERCVEASSASEIKITDEMVSAAEAVASEALSSAESSGLLSEETVRLMLREALRAGGHLTKMRPNRL